MPRHCCPNAVEFNSRLAKSSRVNNMKNVRLLFSALRTFLGKTESVAGYSTCARLMCAFVCAPKLTYVCVYVCL